MTDTTLPFGDIAPRDLVTRRPLIVASFLKDMNEVCLTSGPEPLLLPLLKELLRCIEIAEEGDMPYFEKMNTGLVHGKGIGAEREPWHDRLCALVCVLTRDIALFPE